MKEIKLKPCPFCGSSRIKATTRTFSVNGIEYTNEIVMCLDCQGQVVAPARSAYAICRWNMRVNEKPWPQDGDTYLWIGSTGFIHESDYDDAQRDSDRREFGNFFRTLEEAEAALERVKKALKG